MTTLAFHLAEVGRLPEAEALARQSVDGFHATRASPSKYYVWSLRTMSRILAETARPEEALALLEEEKQVHRGVVHEMGPRDPAIWIRHAECLTRFSRFADAERELLEGRDSFLNATLTDRKNARALIEALVRLYDAWHAAEPRQGHDEKAAAWRAELQSQGRPGER